MGKILLVEDDVDCRRQMALFLTHLGHEVRGLGTATKALEEIDRFRPDLVITDILMPGISGSTLVEEIRNTRGHELPIIVSSGTRMKVKRKYDERLRHVPKPVDFKRLQKVIDELLALRIADAIDVDEGEDID